jgi:hypothetical protein
MSSPPVRRRSEQASANHVRDLSPPPRKTILSGGAYFVSRIRSFPCQTVLPSRSVARPASLNC